MGAVPEAIGVAVVGTRRASDAGLHAARQIASALGARGVVVWSGGARGIDQAAHEGALDAGAVTVICAPSGLSSPYPAGSERLWERAAQRGAVLSLLEPLEKPRLHHFSARNGVLAAMTIATVLVECPLDSGARNTTAHARRLGKPVFVAAPGFGSPFAAAAREECRLGATLVHDTDELLAALGPLLGPLSHAAPAPVARQLGLSFLSDDARVVLATLTATPTHADAVAAKTGLSASAVTVAATELALSGEAVDVPGLGLRAR